MDNQGDSVPARERGQGAPARDPAAPAPKRRERALAGEAPGAVRAGPGMAAPLVRRVRHMAHEDPGQRALPSVPGAGEHRARGGPHRRRPARAAARAEARLRARRVEEGAPEGNGASSGEATGPGGRDAVPAVQGRAGLPGCYGALAMGAAADALRRAEAAAQGHKGHRKEGKACN